MAFHGEEHGIVESSKESSAHMGIRFSIIKSSRNDTKYDNSEVTISTWKSGYDTKLKMTVEKHNEELMSAFERLCYGVGHVLNDLCASMWFSHLLVFYQKVVQVSTTEAGLMLLIGQIVDGIATPIIGIESDRVNKYKYGRRKVWHLGGVIAVALTFPFIFNLCIGCENPSHWSLFVYYIPFIFIFQVGWAAVQISHLSLIPELAANSDEKVVLNVLR